MIEQVAVWNKEYKEKDNIWKKETKSIKTSLKDKKVLELGAGNGKTLGTILRKNPKEITVIDFSQESIEICKKKFQDKNIKFIKADVTKLPFSEEEFDIIVCYYILNNLLEKQREEAAKEIYRVLKKGGKVIFEDFSQGDFREEKKEVMEKHTILKKNGLLCHFFSISELNSLFIDFKKKKFESKTSFPIHNKSKLKRKIISGIIVK